MSELRSPEGKKNLRGLGEVSGREKLLETENEVRNSGEAVCKLNKEGFGGE